MILELSGEIAHHNKFKHRADMVIFVEDIKRPGPFGNGEGTLSDEFEWRRKNGAPCGSANIKELVERMFPQLGPVRKVVWDRRAGCSCPCSPGFKVYFNSSQYTKRSFWAKLAEENC